MGYYAVGSGDIELTGQLPEEVIKLAEIPYQIHFYKENMLEVTADDKYYEDEVYDFLNAVTPYTKQGTIYYSGEDDTQWKFEFKDGEWKEIGSRVVYDDRPALELSMVETQEFYGQLIDEIQDEIEKQEQLGWPHGALIEGDFYDNLKTRLQSVLQRWHVL